MGSTGGGGGSAHNIPLLGVGCRDQWCGICVSGRRKGRREMRAQEESVDGDIVLSSSSLFG